MEWDVNAIARLRTLWAERLPVKAIADRLGTTLNSVVGKAHRLDLPARPSPIKRHGEPAVRVDRAVPKPVGVTLSALPSLDIPMVVGVPAATRAVAAPPRLIAVVMPAPPTPFRRVVACCWPIGHPRDPDFRMCGDAARLGKPYCGFHCDKAYVRVVDRREQAA